MTDCHISIGDRIRYRRPRSEVWREGTVKRWTHSRSGTMLLQVTVDRVDGQTLRPPATARVKPENAERISQL